MRVLDCHYEIELAGQRYFGNLTLNPFHRFEQDGETYLLNVATMKPYLVSHHVVRVLDGAASSFSGRLVSEQAMAELRKLDLVAGLDASAVAPNPSGDAVPAAVNESYGIGRIALFVAQQCNFACVYCFGQGGEYAEKGMMSTETAFKAVDWLMANSADRKTVNIGFFGGEPMMNFSLIKKVVRYAQHKAEKQGKNVTFVMTTNGSLLNPDRIDFLRKQNIHVMVSFDGPPHIQNRQRPYRSGKGSYDRVHANVQKLIKVFPDVSAHAVVWGDADPAEIRAGIKEAGFRTFSMIKASPVILDGPETREASRPDRVDERKMAMEESLARELLQAIKARSLGEVSTKSAVGFFVRQLISGKKRAYFCVIGRGVAAVTATGAVYPCHRFVGQPDMKLGHVETYKIEGMNEYHRATVDTLPECSQCWARYACGGGCFYQNKAVRGDIHLPDRVRCLETKRILEIAIPLYLKLDEEDKAYVTESLERELGDRVS